MEQLVWEHIHPGIITMQAMLLKIDRLRLPLASRRDVESILVRQVGREIDRALPWQSGHGRRTAAISLLIGQAVGLTPVELHDLNLAAFLQRYWALDASSRPHLEVNTLDQASYVAVQNHLGLAPRFSNCSSFSERLPSSWPTSTNDGTDRAILMASGDDSFP